MKNGLRLDSTSYSSLVDHDHEVSALALALNCQEVLTKGSVSSSKTQKRLDFLLHEFLSLSPNLLEPVETLAALNKFLFQNKFLRASTTQEIDSDFFISKILETRCGHPLGLSLIYRHIARRAQTVPVNLVNFPGFFLIKILYRHQLLFLDPAENGRVLTVRALQAKLSNKYGKNLTLNGTFLETPSEIQTITRFLVKLKNIYSEERRWTLLLTVLDMLIATNPQRPLEYRERGMLLFRLGASNEASKDLSIYIEKSQPTPEVEKIRSILNRLEYPNVTPLF